MPVSFWKRQRRTWLRYGTYTLVLAPIGFAFNVATTATASPVLIFVHACFMALIAPNALSLSHVLLEGAMVRAGRLPQPGCVAEVGVTLASQLLGMTATLFLTAALVERFTDLTGLLAGPLVAACALVLAALIIFTLFDAFRQREIALLKMAALATQARFKSLNDQLQPHFLFNSLNVLSEVARRDPQAASDGILALARLYQAIVDLGEETTVPLPVELALVRDYLALIRIRFGDRLTVVFDVAPTSESARVPPLAVFNLVENAVKHGVARIAGPAQILIVASARGNAYAIRVENWPTQASTIFGDRLGKGLANVRDRLCFIYPEAEVRLNNRDDRAVAEITLGGQA